MLTFVISRLDYFNTNRTTTAKKKKNHNFIYDLLFNSCLLKSSPATPQKPTIGLIAGLAQQYISDMLSPHNPSRYLWSQGRNLHVQRACSMSDRMTFSINLPKKWNSLLCLIHKRC